jgi:hypothetical protein
LPLPLPPTRAGAILPPPELRLAAPNWQLGISKPTAGQAVLAAADEAIEQAAKKAKTQTQQHKITINAPSMAVKTE